MRQIKFRAWDSNEKFFHAPMTIEQMLEICCLPSDAIGLMAVKFKITRSSLIFQQFTGLLDKNKVEIYEGDIMKFLDENWLVVYFEQYASFMLQKGNDLANITTQEDKIGNVYENPDLLK